MGVNDLIEDDSRFDGSTTITELEQVFGSEVVRRGLEYMESLEEADENFRKSGNPEDLDEGWSRGFGVGDVDTEASERWAESMEEEGLGLDE